jgi:hypothetical protein
MGLESFGGNDIFGSAVSIQRVPHPNAEQRDEYFGVDGETTLYGGQRGNTFAIKGVFVADNIADLIATEAVFLSYADSIARTLIDPIGRVFSNVYFKGDYQPDPAGNHFVGAGVSLSYTATFFSLTPT